MVELRSLYELWSPSVPVTNANQVFVGTTTRYKAIAHNGKCIGMVEIDTGKDLVWISGFGLKKDAGIQWLEFEGGEGRQHFLTRGVAFASGV